MIFLDAEHLPPDPAPQPLLNSRHLMEACTREAAYLAATLAELDRRLARACTDLSAEAAQTLQNIDLLRQEVEGLAQLMQLIPPDEVAERAIDPEDIRAAAPLRRQRARLNGAQG